jgi:hypothetical protein
MPKRQKKSKNSKSAGWNLTKIPVDKWDIKVFHQKSCPPFLPYCAVAEYANSGKKWIVNEEGNTPDEAVSRLKFRLEKM